MDPIGSISLFHPYLFWDSWSNLNIWLCSAYFSAGLVKNPPMIHELLHAWRSSMAWKVSVLEVSLMTTLNVPCRSVSNPVVGPTSTFRNWWLFFCLASSNLLQVGETIWRFSFSTMTVFVMFYYFIFFHVSLSFVIITYYAYYLWLQYVMIIYSIFIIIDSYYHSLLFLLSLLLLHPSPRCHLISRWSMPGQFFSTFTFFWRDTKSMAGSKMEKGILVATNFLWHSATSPVFFLHLLRQYKGLLPVVVVSNTFLWKISFYIFFTPNVWGRCMYHPIWSPVKTGGWGGEKNNNSIAVSGSFNRG